MEEGPLRSNSGNSEVYLSNSYDDIYENQVPCNTPAEKVQTPKKCSKRQRSWSPCCCGGTLKRWAIVIGVYEIILYGTLISMKLLPIGKFVIPSSIVSVMSKIIHIEEFVTYGLGITTGFVSVLTACTKFRMFCILHSFFSLVLAILLLTLVGLVSAFHKKPFKWVRMLAYIGNSMLHIYFAFYSVAYFKKTKRRSRKRREEKGKNSLNDIDTSLINPRLSFGDDEKSDIEEFTLAANELEPQKTQ